VEKADFDEWKDLFATKQWFGMVSKMREALKEILCTGGTVNSASIEVTAIQTGNITAKIEVLTEILEFKIEGESDA